MNLPNRITILRIFLAPLFICLLIYYDGSHEQLRFWALAVFTVAILSDAVDGIIARKKNERTKLGIFLDPFADKVILTAAFLGIAFSKSFLLKPPLWVVVLIVFRDFFIILGLLSIYFITNQLPISPDALGKTTTFFQMITIFSILSNWSVSRFLWTVTAIVTAFSLLSYLNRGIRFLNHGRSFPVKFF